MPNHMAMPAPGAPVRTWGPNVSHRNAPGAMRAMALDVRPVRPRVGLVAVPLLLPPPEDSAMGCSFAGVYHFQGSTGSPRASAAATGVPNQKRCQFVTRADG